MLSGLFPFKIYSEMFNLIDSWQDGGSAHHKAATYTGQHKWNIQDTHDSSAIRPTRVWEG
jgi:hypothetical protein